MSILTQNNLSSFMNSIIDKTADSLRNITNPQSEYRGIFDYVQLIENISELQSLSVDEHEGIKSLKTSCLDWLLFEKKKHQTKFDITHYLNALILRYQYF